MVHSDRGWLIDASQCHREDTPDQANCSFECAWCLGAPKPQLHLCLKILGRWGDNWCCIEWQSPSEGAPHSTVILSGWDTSLASWHPTWPPTMMEQEFPTPTTRDCSPPTHPPKGHVCVQVMPEGGWILGLWRVVVRGCGLWSLVGGCNDVVLEYLYDKSLS